MAKKTTKKGGISTSPYQKKGADTEKGTANAPELDEKAFSELSKKIQAQFQDFHDSKKTNNSEQTTKSGNRRDTKPKKIPLETSAKPGKKRDHEGKLLNKPKSRDANTPTAEGGAVLDTFEEEVYALGGTAEDLQLLEGVQSDSEVEADDLKSATLSQSDKGLEKGISNILSEIALAKTSHAEHNLGDNASETSLDEEGNTTADTMQAPVRPSVSLQQPKKKSNLTVDPRPDWFNTPVPGLDFQPNQTYTLSHQSLDQLKQHALSLLDADNESFKALQQSTPSQSFYSTVIASGTLADKISALTLAVQDSPLHNCKALESLVSLAKKRSRAQAVDVLRALKDLFALGSLLPSDRKLYSFSMQPGLLSAFGKTKSWKSGDSLPSSVKPQHLMLWAFEGWLKEQYFEVLKTLEVWCNDEIEFSKLRAVTYVFELLKEKPEQESNLLRLLINKLGDPVKKVASQTSYLLMQLMGAHPLMKNTIISSIESDLLFRPGQSVHAKYYAIITLNQTGLSSKEEQVASKLLELYFSLFVWLLKPTEEPQKPKSLSSANGEAQGHHGRRRKQRPKGKGSEKGAGQDEELREKLTSAILTGINRAYPYTSSDQQKLSVHMDALFRITHSSNFNTSVQAMMLIQQLCSSHQVSTDRFYRTLYESLLDARLATSSKQSLYLNLLYRALKGDVNIKRVKAFAKRILQILTLHDASFVCGAFFLLKELEVTFPSLGGLIDQAEDQDDQEENFQDIDEILENADEPHTPNLNTLQRKELTTYDGRKRDPEHSNAENSCLWELLPFLAHYHPSVSVSADHVLNHTKLVGKPDLNLHTLIHFLDRFAYRNPKLASSNLRGSSIMQPLGNENASSVLVGGAGRISQERTPVNSEGFRMKKNEDVAAEDVFFHKYFNSIGRESQKKKEKHESRAADETDDEDDESEIWKAMVDSAPDLEGAASSDEDLEMADLDSDFEESLDDLSDIEGFENGSEIGSEANEGGLSEEFGDEMQGFDGSSDSEADEVPVATSKINEKARASNPVKDAAKSKRRQMKQLPTFASASDYAKMLEDDDGEDVGY